MSILSRKKKFRREYRRRIVIVCEGEKTEKNYFSGFIDRYSNVQIVPLFGKATDPKNIVDLTKKQKKEYNLNFEDGDGLWCVFDVDNNPEEAIVNSVGHAQRFNIGVALSNPCFELWYILHFTFMNSGLTKDDAIVYLKKYIHNYEKKKNYNTDLKGKTSTAIKNAKRLNSFCDKEGIDLYCRKSNPSTQVFRLVEFIEETINKNRDTSK